MSAGVMVDISTLPDELRVQVVRHLNERRLADDYLMTYADAAEIYGYSYGSIRKYCARGAIRTVHTITGPRIMHASMRAYINKKRIAGRPLVNA